MKNECIGCTERHLHCHTDCQKYIEACKKNEERKRKIKAAKKDSKLFDDYKFDRIEREKKRSH